MSILLYQDGLVAADTKVIVKRNKLIGDSIVTTDHMDKLFLSKENDLIFATVGDTYYHVDDEIMNLAKKIAQFYETIFKFSKNGTVDVDDKVVENSIIQSLIDELFDKTIMINRDGFGFKGILAFFTKRYFYQLTTIKSTKEEIIPSNGFEVDLLTAFKKYKTIRIASKTNHIDEYGYRFFHCPRDMLGSQGIGNLGRFATYAFSNGEDINDVMAYILDNDYVCGEKEDVKACVMDCNLLKVIPYLKKNILLSMIKPIVSKEEKGEE